MPTRTARCPRCKKVDAVSEAGRCKICGDILAAVAGPPIAYSTTQISLVIGGIGVVIMMIGVVLIFIFELNLWTTAVLGLGGLILGSRILKR
jgi:hypothetical protein